MSAYLFVLSLFVIGSLWSDFSNKLTFLERISLSVVTGASLLPFALFIVNWSAGIRVIRNTGLALVLMTILITIYVMRLHVHGYRKKAAWKLEENLTERLLCGILVISAIIFLYEVISNLPQPIFGWDEFSFWVYAARALYYADGSCSAMIGDHYASYPLGFPYLIAWYFQLAGVSIVNSKVITPLISLFYLAAVHSVFKRMGFSNIHAWMAVLLIVWGTVYYFLYNVLAYGEVIYVDTLSLAILYAVSYMRNKEWFDLYTFSLLLGLSAFLRVDGSIVTVIAYALFLVFNPRLVKHPVCLLFVLIPSVAWQIFKASHHIHGWTTRLSLSEVAFRLRHPFVDQMFQSFSSTLANLATYPIVGFLCLALILSLSFRQKEIYFLLLFCVSQIFYLFAAYLTVFSRFEALHASSMDRYLIRIEPVVAFACVLLMSNRKSHERKRGVTPIPTSR